jgi:prevent-host-death family protein
MTVSRKPAWQLQTAKARFSEVFELARSKGPQWVSRRGKESVVILPAEEFERLTQRAQEPRSLTEFLARSPLARARLRLERIADYGRPVKL